MRELSLFELGAPAPSHPAKYTDALLLTMAKMLQGRTRILDPFGGTGKVFLLEHWLGNVEIQATEIEPEWAAKNPRTTLGNALALPWADGYFDAICTSPTYGNGMASTYRDHTVRMTYTDRLGRKLHEDNSGQLHWGPRYRDFHHRAWMEARRVLAVGGAFVLNIKDHMKTGSQIPVTDWHIETLGGLGFRAASHIKIDVPSLKFGMHSQSRVPYESVILFTLEPTP